MSSLRIGTRRMLELLDKIVSGKGEEGDIEKLELLAKNIKASALCGLGQTAPNPVLSTIRYFRDEYETHIRKNAVLPVFVRLYCAILLWQSCVRAVDCVLSIVRLKLYRVREESRTL